VAGQTEEHTLSDTSCFKKANAHIIMAVKDPRSQAGSCEQVIAGYSASQKGDEKWNS